MSEIKEKRDKIRISFGNIVRYQIAGTKEWITEIEYLEKRVIRNANM